MKFFPVRDVLSGSPLIYSAFMKLGHKANTGTAQLLEISLTLCPIHTEHSLLSPLTAFYNQPACLGSHISAHGGILDWTHDITEMECI